MPKKFDMPPAKLCCLVCVAALVVPGSVAGMMMGAAILKSALGEDSYGDLISPEGASISASAASVTYVAIALVLLCGGCFQNNVRTVDAQTKLLLMAYFPLLAGFAVALGHEDMAWDAVQSAVCGAATAASAAAVVGCFKYTCCPDSVIDEPDEEAGERLIS